MPRNGVKQWTAARQQDIEDAYNDHASWTTLDEITRSHKYNFSSIAEWPVDGCLVCTPTEKSALLLGSLQAACNLSVLKEDLGFSVTVVVSMCDAEMRVHGSPANWNAYFSQQNAFHIRCHVGDLTVKQPKRNVSQYQALRDECLCTWKSICFQLWQQSILAVVAEKPMNILFHCFGGINRSAAILCAWLIAAHDYSAQETIQILLQKRPSLRPWRHRDYVLDALWLVGEHRLQWQRDFVTASTFV
eukprot:s2744_g5.t1